MVDSTFEKHLLLLSLATETSGGLIFPAADRVSGGRAKTFVVSPESAFGQPNPNNIQGDSSGQIPSDMTLEEGLMVSFSDAGED